MSDARLAAASLTALNVSAVSQGTDLLDIFGVDAGQRIYHASWRPDDANGWNRSAQLNGGLAAPYTSVYAVSRFNGRLDAFAVGTDRRVYTAFKDTGVSRGAWQGWWQIPGLTVQENTSVSAVKLDTNNMMILAVGEDGTVYNNFWSAALPGQWQGWQAVLGTLATVQSTVFGLAISNLVVDIYATGVPAGAASRRPFYNRWHASSGWQGWRQIGTIGTSAFANTGSLYPVRYGNNDVALFGTFVVVSGRSWEWRIVTAAVDLGRQAWSSWAQLLDGRAYDAMAPITAVSRRPGYIDVFHVGRDRHVYTAAYNKTDGWVRLVISSSGAWSFRGHFNSAGPLTYNVGYTGLVAIPDGRGFAFQAKGTAEGWVDGGDDYDFDRAGVDPDIAAAWSQIRISGEWSARARTSLDVGRLLGDLLMAAAYAVRITDIVSSA